MFTEIGQKNTQQTETNFKPRPLLHAQSYLVVLQTATDLILALEGRRGGTESGDALGRESNYKAVRGSLCCTNETHQKWPERFCRKIRLIVESRSQVTPPS